MARILIIDDDYSMRFLLRVLLESEGYEIVEAQDGFEGFRHYQTAPTELVITDLFMPQKDGLEMIEDLRRLYPAIKIIAISGNSNLLGIAKSSGAQHTLPKPFELQEMCEAVRQLIET